jgi:hypothetical protein
LFSVLSQNGFHVRFAAWRSNDVLTYLAFRYKTLVCEAIRVVGFMGLTAFDVDFKIKKTLVLHATRQRQSHTRHIE